MKFKALTLLLLSALALNIACQKEEENKININVDLDIKMIPDGSSSPITPLTHLALTFNQKIEVPILDKSSNKYYKFIFDSAFIKTKQGIIVPSEKYLFASNDTLKLIPNYDFNQDETYVLTFKYKTLIKHKNIGLYEIYVKNGVPQEFTFTKEFTVANYPYFDPDFMAIQNPPNGTTNILQYPYFKFSHIIEKPYAYSPLKINYRICVDSAGIYTLQGQTIPSTFQISSGKDTLKIIPSQLLNYGDNYKTSIKYHIEIKKGSLDEYQLLKKDSETYYGRIQNTFTIEGSNFTIDTSQVEYAYPWPYQYHFLKNETSRGVLKLKNSTKQNFNTKGFTFFVRYTSTLGESWDVNATYDPANLKFIFQIPSDNLENQKIYKIEFIAMDAKKSLSVFLTYHFRTSMFNTFEEKVNSISNIRYWFEHIDQQITYIKRIVDIAEPFDFAEGKPYFGLIRFEALTDSSNYWLHRTINLYYSGLNANSLKVKWRSTSVIPAPPLNAIILEKTQLTPLLSQTQIETGIAEAYSKNPQKVNYQLGYYVYYDHFDIRSQILSKPIKSEWENNFINNHYRGFTYGRYYYFIAKYVCGDAITSEVKWEISL